MPTILYPYFPKAFVNIDPINPADPVIAIVPLNALFINLNLLIFSN